MRTETVLLSVDAARQLRGETIRAWFVALLHGEREQPSRPRQPTPRLGAGQAR